jgi:hypothetical protein
MQVLNAEIVEEWLSRVSKNSAKTYRYHLRHFLQYFDMTAEMFLEEAQKTLTFDLKQRAAAQRSVEAKLNKYYNHLIENGASYNTAVTAERVVKAFLRYNKIADIDTPPCLSVSHTFLLIFNSN